MKTIKNMLHEKKAQRIAQGDVALTFDDDRFGGRQATLFVKGTGTIDIPASQGKNFLSVVKKLKDSDFK